MSFECKCGFDTNSTTGDVTRAYMDRTTTTLNEAIVRVGEKYRNETNFKVVINRAFEKMDITKFPDELISRIDCFHPSVRAHELMAIKSWNDMWGGKDTGQAFDVEMYCPTDQDRLQ